MKRTEKLKNRTGITEEKLRELIDEVLLSMVDEVSTTSGSPGYLTPKAFDGNGKSNKKFRTKNGEQFGLKKIRDDLEDKKSMSENRYLRFKQSEGSTKQKIGNSIREINQSLNELDCCLKMNLKLKKEQGASSADLWKRTSNHLSRIESRLINMAHKVRELKS